MKKEQNNQKKEQKKDDCPLCQVQDETIKILKEAGKKKEEAKK